ncbi:MAG TPA: hypothetical protein VEI83_13350 [Acidimicrobiales bacterium]|nr:hypothetical protein [Acidimicrobiales bacterium]
MITADQWQTLYEMSASPDDESVPLLASAAHDVEAELHDFNRDVSQLFPLFDRLLLGNRSSSTWGDLKRVIALSVGPATANMASWIVGVAMDDRWRLVVDLGADAESTRKFFAPLLDRYALEMEDAYKIWQELPGDWKSIHRDIFQDQIQGQTVVSITFTTYGGESLTLDMPGRSFLRLLGWMTDSLKFMAPAAAYEPQAVADLASSLDLASRWVAGHGNEGDETTSA